jgi:hypothetical protein
LIFFLSFSFYFYRRKYKLRFYNRHEFYDWKQLFLDHDPNYIKAQHTLARTASSTNSKISGLPSLMAAQSAATSFLAGRTLASAAGSKENNLSLPSLTGGMMGFTAFDSSSFASGSDDKMFEITYDNENTKKYSKQLKNGERVIGCGQVMKHERVMRDSNATNAPKQRRILLVTDLPRMIYVDTIGNMVRGSTELVAESKMEIKAVRKTFFSFGSIFSLITCLLVGWQ